MLRSGLKAQRGVRFRLFRPPCPLIFLYFLAPLPSSPQLPAFFAPLPSSFHILCWPPCPPKGGFVSRHEQIILKNENEPPFRGVGGQKPQKKQRGLGVKKPVSQRASNISPNVPPFRGAGGQKPIKHRGAGGQKPIKHRGAGGKKSRASCVVRRALWALKSSSSL
jgi:hypothetical protein